MAYENLVAMHVVDASGYARYREHVTPLLHEFGGDFRHDFEISGVLRSDVKHPVTRLFVIRFPDSATCERFFTDPRYLAGRREFFVPSVAAYTVIAAFDRET